MPLQAKLRFDGNKKDILILWHIHAEVAGSGRARRHRVDVLNRAAIIFISACWESYVEDLAMEAFDYLLEKASNPDAFPMKVRTAASRELREAKDERKIWELAGDGWRQIFKNHRDTLQDRWLNDFNTPKSRQVSELFFALIGIPDVKSSWTWKAMSADEAVSKLDDCIIIRGNIAHRTTHDETVYKNWGRTF